MADNQGENLNPILRRMHNYLTAKRIAPTQADKLMDSGYGRFGKMIKNNTVPKKPFIEKFLLVFTDVNEKWLESENGDMIKTANKNQDLKERIVNMPYEENLADKGIPMFDSPTTASQVEVYNDIVNEGPAFYVTIPQFKDCKFGKLVYGHSMYPTITSGSYVFCKPVTNKANFLPGEIYYIEYDNFGVCKRLQKGESRDEVVLVSDNVEVRPDGTRRYESFTLKFDEIRELYIVKGFFNQNHN